MLALQARTFNYSLKCNYLKWQQLVFLSKLLVSLIRNYYPKRTSGAPLHTLSKLYDVPVGIIPLPLLRQCMAIFAVAEGWLLLDNRWSVLFLGIIDCFRSFSYTLHTFSLYSVYRHEMPLRVFLLPVYVLMRVIGILQLIPTLYYVWQASNLNIVYHDRYSYTWHFKDFFLKKIW